MYSLNTVFTTVYMCQVVECVVHELHIVYGVYHIECVHVVTSYGYLQMFISCSNNVDEWLPFTCCESGMEWNPLSFLVLAATLTLYTYCCAAVQYRTALYCTV